MQQYFIEGIIKQGDMIEMNKEQSHHIANVMRMKENEVIRLCDEHQQMYFSRVHFEQRQVYAIAEEFIEDHTHNRVHITLAQGLIKGEKWDYLLQKSAELGVDEIIPFTSSRCVVKAKDDKMDRKMERWNKILLEACEQCKRSSQVLLHPPLAFQDLCQQDYELKLIAYEDADQISNRLCDILKKHSDVTRILIVIGCEGGFAKEEVAVLENSGFLRASLGARILRAETAALSLLSNIAFFYDMEGESK